MTMATTTSNNKNRDASNATQTDSLKGNARIQIRLSRGPISITSNTILVTINNDNNNNSNNNNNGTANPLDNDWDKNASQESRIGEAIDILDSEKTSSNNRVKRRCLRRKGSSISEQSAKEMLHDNCDRLSSLLMQTRRNMEMTSDGFHSSDDDESDLEDS
ncbi:unnamed protein product [Cylindrotheca closterium]|uniref:Uncharacterized protein n=1 Tax=Cylindrotheca closterium TaxID=2856 RepID=A0AAD2GBR4_9STRA|nr:unnamed protein product [Cylindrotheca closterium]